MTRLALCVAGLLATAAVARPNSPDPNSPTVPPEKLSRARELVRQLGSEAYRERDRATRELRRMGRFALTVLADAAVAEGDPEIKARCGELLPAAEAEDMAVRVAAFLADADGKLIHDLPGWDVYRAVAGNDPPARQLFVDILKNADNHPVLLAARSPDERLTKALAVRRQQVQARFNPGMPVPFRPVPPNVPDMAVVLLAESLIPDRSGAVIGLPFQMTTFFYQPAGREAASGNGQYGPAFRRLTLRWIETRDGPNGAMTAMSLAQNLQLGPDVVIKVAGRALAAEGAPIWVKSQALAQLSQNATAARDQLPAVAKLFADKTIMTKGAPNTPVTEDIQVRDAALAVAIFMTGQDAKTYGLDAVQPLIGLKVNPSGYRFRSDDKLTADQKRDAAFKTWAEWEAKAVKNAKP